MTDVDGWLEDLVEAEQAGTIRLSEWEAEFIENMQDKDELSDKQAEKIFNIWSKYSI